MQDERARFNALLDEMLKRGIMQQVLVISPSDEALELYELVDPDWRQTDISSRGRKVYDYTVTQKKESSIYPFATMPTGDFFFVPVGPRQPKLAGFRVYCAKRGKDLSRRFRCELQPSGDYRVTRLA